MEFPNASARAGEHALSARTAALSTCWRASSSTNTSIPRTWRCAACSLPSASSRASRSSLTRALARAPRQGERAPAIAHGHVDHLRSRSPSCRTRSGTRTGAGSTCFRATPTFTANRPSTTSIPRTGFFAYAYSTSPGMAVNMENVGAKYPVNVRGLGRRLPARRPGSTSCSCPRIFRPAIVLVGDRLRSR